MQTFTITIGRRGEPRLQFACMAPDSSTAVMQHIELAEVGERVEVQIAECTCPAKDMPFGRCCQVESLDRAIAQRRGQL